MERGNFKNPFKKGPSVAISNYLEEELVLFLKAENQLDALKSLVNCLDAENRLLNKEAFFQAILEREKIVSTGIGVGVAIPHAKLAGYEDFFIVIGIQKGKGIEWQSLDGLPVRIIFMIGGPENRQSEYLSILSLITTAIKSEERRKKLLKAETAQEVIQVFADL